MWYRIFGSRSEMPSSSAILDCLRGRYASVLGEFATDESGWYQADILVDGVALQLERYLAEESGLRAELNSWAAWLETREDNPESPRLMERVIQTTQLFTLSAGADSRLARDVGEALCRFLAGVTVGVYQIDGQGFFAADGALLVSE